MKLILTAPDNDLYKAFENRFHYVPNVEIVNKGFEWIPSYDCLVSPANSFGMSGATPRIFNALGNAHQDWMVVWMQQLQSFLV